MPTPLAAQTPAFEAELIHQMAHSPLIAALEAYLADTVSYWVGHDNAALRRFVSRNKDFKARAFKLIVQAGLDIVVPDVGGLMREVVIRHDIVHRAGRTRDGDVASVSTDCKSGRLNRTVTGTRRWPATLIR